MNYNFFHTKKKKVDESQSQFLKTKGLFRFFCNRGQSIMEYALLTAAVAAAFLVMQQFILRATQAKLKLVEDQINQPVVVVNP